MKAWTERKPQIREVVYCYSNYDKKEQTVQTKLNMFLKQISSAAHSDNDADDLYPSMSLGWKCDAGFSFFPFFVAVSNVYQKIFRNWLHE